MTKNSLRMELDVTHSTLDHNDIHVNLLDNRDRADNEHNDTAFDGSFNKCFKKHRKVIVIGICIGVGIGFVVCYLAHHWNSVNQDNGNTSNNVASHANASGRTSPSEQETCIFHTPEKFLEKQKEDPLEDTCNKSSNHVQNFCNESGTSTQQCMRCGTKGIYLPDFCFCDQVGHCNDPLHDRKGTIKCEDCLEMFSKSPYKDRGNCSCSFNEVMIKCSCNEGFANDICSSIEKRLCSRKKTNETPENCNESKNDKCVFTRSDGTEFICNIFSGKSIDLSND